MWLERKNACSTFTSEFPERVSRRNPKKRKKERNMLLQREGEKKVSEHERCLTFYTVCL